MNVKAIFSGFSLAAMSWVVSVAASAQDGINDLERIGKPVPKGLGFQPASSVDAEITHTLGNVLFWVSGFLCVFVSILLLIVIIKFRDTGKEPKRFSHNTPLEIAWTLVPVLILIVLMTFSVPALKAQTRVPEGDVVIHATGNQWYWSYEYPEEGIAFDSYLLQKDQLAAYGYQEDEYLLATDNALVVPVGKMVVVEITGADVIHSWKLPAFAVQADAVPGRTLVQHFTPTKEGIYFGQCSELCGKDHAYMPITLKVVSEEVYQQWLAKAKVDFAAG